MFGVIDLGSRFCEFQENTSYDVAFSTSSNCQGTSLEQESNNRLCLFTIESVEIRLTDACVQLSKMLRVQG